MFVFLSVSQQRKAWNECYLVETQGMSNFQKKISPQYFLLVKPSWRLCAEMLVMAMMCAG